MVLLKLNTVLPKPSTVLLRLSMALQKPNTEHPSQTTKLQRIVNQSHPTINRLTVHQNTALLLIALLHTALLLIALLHTALQLIALLLIALLHTALQLIVPLLIAPLLIAHLLTAHHLTAHLLTALQLPFTLKLLTLLRTLHQLTQRLLLTLHQLIQRLLLTLHQLIQRLLLTLHQLIQRPLLTNNQRNTAHQLTALRLLIHHRSHQTTKLLLIPKLLPTNHRIIHLRPTKKLLILPRPSLNILHLTTRIQTTQKVTKDPMKIFLVSPNSRTF
jgi:hypothetical protein